MKILQKIFLNNHWKTVQQSEGFRASEAQLVLAFGNKKYIENSQIVAIAADFPHATIVSSSTAGEILEENFHENSLTVTAIQLEKSKIECLHTNYYDHSSNSFEIGRFLMKKIPKENLVYVLVISDGSLINGTELVEGIASENTDNVLVTGGLAGDGANFVSTLVGINSDIRHGNVTIVGFYGSSFYAGHGSLGGWDEFGPERFITKSNKNVLYQLEDKNALDLYKEYLGSYADELPSSSLLFPLSISIEGKSEKNVRTILSIDETEKSMTFAGNMPEGALVRLMKANFDKLIHASSKAAEAALNAHFETPDLALLISCVGRRIILNERVEEEIENARKVLGDKTFITGFYSYGEISPFIDSMKCELQNQTMTITTFSEK
jgi:hypothetical protein